MEKIYRVKLNSKGAPDFSTAVEIADRPQAKWVATVSYQKGQIVYYDYKCSICGHHRDRRMNYCEICGARMRPLLQGKHFDSIIIDESATKGADDDYDR